MSRESDSELLRILLFPNVLNAFSVVKSQWRRRCVYTNFMTIQEKGESCRRDGSFSNHFCFETHTIKMRLIVVCFCFVLVTKPIVANGDFDEYEDEIESKILDILKNRGINITNTIVLNQKPGVNTVITNEVVNKPVVNKPFITEVVTSEPLPGEIVPLSSNIDGNQEYVIISTSKPIKVKPASPQPVVTKPGSPQPVVAKPGSPQPVVAKPGSPQPVITKPVSSQSVNTKPVNSQSVTTKPVTTKPVTIKPGTVVQKPSGTKLNATSAVQAVQAETTTATPFFRNPCKCLNGICMCCTGRILESFNQKACLKVTYEPNDFAFTAQMLLNDRVFFKRKISGKNPPPMCLRVPRLPAVKLCMRFSNVYFSGANMHTCINFEASFQEFTLIDTSLDCIRIGSNGIASVQPEDGGGTVIVDEDDDLFPIEDYDDSA